MGRGGLGLEAQRSRSSTRGRGHLQWRHAHAVTRGTKAKRKAPSSATTGRLAARCAACPGRPPGSLLFALGLQKSVGHRENWKPVGPTEEIAVLVKPISSTRPVNLISVPPEDIRARITRSALVRLAATEACPWGNSPKNLERWRVYQVSRRARGPWVGRSAVVHAQGSAAAGAHRRSRMPGSGSRSA